MGATKPKHEILLAKKNRETVGVVTYCSCLKDGTIMIETEVLFHSSGNDTG